MSCRKKPSEKSWQRAWLHAPSLPQHLLQNANSVGVWQLLVERAHGGRIGIGEQPQRVQETEKVSGYQEVFTGMVPSSLDPLQFNRAHGHGVSPKKKRRRQKKEKKLVPAAYNGWRCI